MKRMQARDDMISRIYVNSKASPTRIHMVTTVLLDTQYPMFRVFRPTTTGFSPVSVEPFTCPGKGDILSNRFNHPVLGLHEMTLSSKGLFTVSVNNELKVNLDARADKGLCDCSEIQLELD